MNWYQKLNNLSQMEIFKIGIVSFNNFSDATQDFVINRHTWNNIIVKISGQLDELRNGVSALY